MSTNTEDNIFDNLSDEVLIEIATYSWDDLKMLCSALSLDLHLKEQNESNSSRRDLH